MTQRTPTLWKPNPSKSAGVAYSSPAVQYSSTTTRYSTADAAKADDGKLPEAWTPNNKVATAWKPNPAATTSLYPYDSASKVYDSASDTYDGIVSGQDFGDIQTPTAWSPL